jgi:hypothetical protein
MAILVGANAFQLVSGKVITDGKNVEVGDLPEGFQPSGQFSLPVNKKIAYKLMVIDDIEDTRPNDGFPALELRNYYNPSPTDNGYTNTGNTVGSNTSNNDPNDPATNYNNYKDDN